jgi:hypothetical protein
MSATGVEDRPGQYVERPFIVFGVYRGKDAEILEAYDGKPPPPEMMSCCSCLSDALEVVQEFQDCTPQWTDWYFWTEKVSELRLGQ